MKRVLIIEDEEVLLTALTEKLKRAGYDVLGARDGESGFEAIQTGHPDLILLDLLLPKKHGMQILLDMRGDPELAKIPVIVISNSGQPVEMEQIMAMGVRDYLVKANFTPEEVLEKVEKIVISPQPEARSASALPGKGYDVMVVEDDRFLRELIVRKLTAIGFAVTEAIDGTEALKLLETAHPHVLLLDLVMPGIDGIEVLQRLKANSATAKLPVIILSNLGQQESVARAQALGVADYLVKAQFTLDEIVAKVQKVLRETYL